MMKKTLLILLTTSSFSAVAEDWNVSVSSNVRNATFSLPGAGYKDNSWSVTPTLYKKLGDWYVGASLSYSEGRIDTDANSGRYRPDTTSLTGFAMRDIGSGRFVDASLSYGDSVLDSSRLSGATTVTYRSRNDFLSAGAGLTQYIPLSEKALASVSARYTHIDSNSGGYTDSTNRTVPKTDSRWGFFTVGANLSYQIDSFSPYARVGWNKANREFMAGTNDNDYFNYGAGVNYTINKETSVGFSYSSVTGKSYAKENNVGLSLSYKF